MSSTGVRNTIIALIILAIGSWLLLKIGNAFIPKNSVFDFTGILASIESLFSLFIIGIVVIIIILIPVWIAKKREESKQISNPPAQPKSLEYSNKQY
ncbi:MAG: hypothetical protein V1870_00885 [Candidatus Aenigmatarchaeota archaeon]